MSRHKQVSNRYGLKVPWQSNHDGSSTGPVPSQDDIEFEFLDASVSDTARMGVAQYRVEQCANNNLYEEFCNELLEQEDNQDSIVYQSTVTINGTMSSGTSVSVIVPFQPYFFVHVPLHWKENSPHVTTLVQWVAKGLRLSASSLRGTLERKERFYGWVPDASDPTKIQKISIVKLEFPSLRSMRRATYLLKDTIELPGIGQVEVQVYEDKVQPLTKFCDVCNVFPSGWIRVKKGQWQYPTTWTTHGQIEIITRCAAIEPIPERDDIAPFLLASVDIESYSKSHEFPDAKNPDDPVITIATTFYRYGRQAIRLKQVAATLADNIMVRDVAKMIIGYLSDDYEFTRIVYCLKKTEAWDEHHIVESFDTEQELLQAWRDLIVLHADPDMITGWNIYGYDWPTLSRRMEHYLALSQSRFYFLSRFIAEPTPLKKNEFDSKAFGQSDAFEFHMHGRVVFDLYRKVKREYKFRNYTLGFVSTELLKRTKIDLDPKELFRLWELDCPKARAQIAEYCARDTELPLGIALCKIMIPALVEMSRVTYTTMADINSRGQQIKVYNQIVIEGHRMGVVINYDPSMNGNTAGYEGATVIDPKAGFYGCPIATLDFASLYPSIMRANNLCPSRLVMQSKYVDLPGVEYHKIKSTIGTHIFVKNPKGVTPKILEKLLKARKAARKIGAETTDPELADIMDQRQLSLKISCNSVYGYYGAIESGITPCLPVADATTCMGRSMIDQTKQAVESRYAKSEVIYGDTDSVFVKFDVPASLEGRIEAFRLGKEAAKAVSDMFDNEAIDLTFEKIYDPLLMLKKKRYVGNKYVDDKNPHKAKMMEAKGVEMVRRDACKYVTDTQEAVLRALIQESNPVKARAVLQKRLDDLLEDRIPFQDFILTKSVKREYASENQLQVVLINKMRAREPGSEPRVGDRCSFVVTDPKNKGALYEKADDPVWVQKHNIPLDKKYYIESGIMNSMLTFFEPFVAEPESLFIPSLITLCNRRDGYQSIANFLIPAPKPISTQTVTVEPDPLDPPSSNSSATLLLPQAPRRTQMTLFGMAAPAAPPPKKQGVKRPR